MNIDAKRKELDRKILDAEIKLAEKKKKISDRQGISEIESAATGAYQGVTLGFGDEINAGVKSLFKGTKYDDEVKDQRDYVDAARQVNPNSYLAGDLGGSIATGFIPGLGLAKGAGLAKRALSGAVTGGVEGLGRSGEGANPAIEAGKGALFGLGAGLVGGVAAAKLFSKKPVEAVTEEVLQNHGLIGSALNLGTDEFGQRAGKVIADSGDRLIIEAASGKHGNEAQRAVRNLAVQVASQPKPKIRNADDFIRVQGRYRKAIADTSDKVADIIGEGAEQIKDRSNNFYGAVGKVFDVVRSPLIGGAKMAGSLFKSARNPFQGEAYPALTNAAIGASAASEQAVSSNLYAPENDAYLKANLPQEQISSGVPQ